MNFKYNAALLKKVEEIFKEGGYTVRYEKGNFQNGYCVLEKRRVVVINKFHEVEAKINSMMEILVTIQGDTTKTPFLTYPDLGLTCK